MPNPQNPLVITVDAILFDMDGTLLDSTYGVLSAWQKFSLKYGLGDHTVIAHATHGRRLHDTLKAYCRIDDEKTLLDAVDSFEHEVMHGGLVALPGATDLTSQLASDPVGRHKWTIVTSASNKYAPKALEQAGIPVPFTGIITANDVSQGKPHPAPYLAGASLCSTDITKCLVIEDAISGLKAGKAAGALTLAVCTSTSRATLLEGGNPDYVVEDLTQVTVAVSGDQFEISIALDN